MQALDPSLLPQTIVDIDLGALAHNIRSLKGLLPRGTEFMAVVKANAYGHGAVRTALTAVENGAGFLAVARISEAVELREAGIGIPILLFGDISPHQVPYLAANDIRITLTSLDSARMIQETAGNQNKRLKVHIKIDTGMGRLGILHDQIVAPGTGRDRAWESVREVLSIQEIKELEVEGIYTHLANADARDKTHTLRQLNRFKLLLEKLEKKGKAPPIRHAANSAAVIDMPESHLKMVRPGIAMYGLWPSGEINRTRILLKPVMSIRSKIIQLKDVPKGFKISYGSTHVTQAPTRIATVPIGYADGYSRLLSSRGSMLVRGQKAPVVGKVCMDFTMIDVGNISGVKLGDEVMVMGSQGGQTIAADDIAATIGTINYEVAASLTRRMPINYKNTGDSGHEPV